MRIALVLEQFNPRRGGLEQWTTRFATRLAQRGHEVHVVAGHFDDRALSCTKNGALPIVAHRIENVGRRLQFAEAAQAKLFAIAPDVIHDMGCGWYCDVFHPHGGSWASITERKLLLQPRWLRPLKRRIDRMLRRQREFQVLMSRQFVDHGQILVALSRSVADDFQRFHRVSPERIRVVYNGVDTDRFSPAHRGNHRRAIRRQLGVGDDTLLALIVAHNFRLKGVATLLRALRRLSLVAKPCLRGQRGRLPIHLAVVGGKRLRGWRRMAERLGVAAAVSFVGAQDETVPYYAAADVYVHPTFYDTCSLVVLEAAASGLPVITSRLNGVSELFDPVSGQGSGARGQQLSGVGQGSGIRGQGFGVQLDRIGKQGSDPCPLTPDPSNGALLLSDPADVEELTESLRVLFDPSRRQKMGNAARRTALKHTFSRNVEEILAVYEEAVGSGRAAAKRREGVRG